MLVSNVRTTTTRYGRMAYYAADAYIGRSLELYGEYSPDEVNLWRKFVKPGWTVVNGGANIGALTIPLAELVGPKGRVYGFEPQPEAYQLLKRNVAKRKNITISDYGLWHSRGDSRMRLYAELGHDNYGCTPINDQGSAPARLIALDDWLQGEDVDFIALDIEGSEMMALEGAKQTIDRCQPVLYLENYTDAYGQNLIYYVRQKGYVCYTHKPDMYSKDNWKKCPEDVFLLLDNFENKPSKTISYNILCVPTSRLEEFRGVTEHQTKFHDEPLGSKLQMIVPKAPYQGKMGWAAIARCGGVGDNLISACALKPLKELGYKVEVITQYPQGVVFENNPYVDKLSIYEQKDWPQPWENWLEWHRLRAREYEKFVNYSHSIECRHALLPVQLQYWWPQEYRRKLCAGSYLETTLDILGLPHTFGPLFHPTHEEREQAYVTKRKLGGGPIIAWSLSGSRLDKVYPYASLVVGRLIKELGATVVLMGAPPPHRDASLAKVIMDTVEAQNGNLTGLVHAGSPSLENQTWPIRRILTFAAACDLYIGTDTGPSWGVAFEPIPKMIMVSHTSVENITSHWVNTTTLHADPNKVGCWPCHRLHNTFETCNPIKINDVEFAACISNINAETIVATARGLLSK